MNETTQNPRAEDADDAEAVGYAVNPTLTAAMTQHLPYVLPKYRASHVRPNLVRVHVPSREGRITTVCIPKALHTRAKEHAEAQGYRNAAAFVKRVAFDLLANNQVNLSCYSGQVSRAIAKVLDEAKSA